MVWSVWVVKFKCKGPLSNKKLIPSSDALNSPTRQKQTCWEDGRPDLQILNRNCLTSRDSGSKIYFSQLQVQTWVSFLII